MSCSSCGRETPRIIPNNWGAWQGAATWHLIADVAFMNRTCADCARRAFVAAIIVAAVVRLGDPTPLILGAVAAVAVDMAQAATA